MKHGNAYAIVIGIAVAVSLTGCSSSKPAPAVPHDVQHMLASTAAPMAAVSTTCDHAVYAIEHAGELTTVQVNSADTVQEYVDPKPAIDALAADKTADRASRQAAMEDNFSQILIMCRLAK